MIATAYRKFVDHMGKVLSGLGASLVGIDLMGVADPLKGFAREWLGANGVKWVAAGLFFALFLRTAYTGWKAKQPDPATLPPPVTR